MKPNEVNQIAKDTVIFREKETVEAVGMVMKGKICAKSTNFCINLGVGSFIGMNDIYGGTYLCDYSAAEDSQVYMFPVKTSADIANIFRINKDYRGLAVYYLDRYIFELNKIKTHLKTVLSDYIDFIKKEQDASIEIGKKTGYKFPPIPEINALACTEAESEPGTEKLNYYLENVRIPTSTLKEFYGLGEQITLFHIKEQAELIEELAAACGEYEDAIEEALSLTVNKNRNSLFFFQGRLASAGAKNGGNEDIIKLMDKVIEAVTNIEKIFDTETGRGAFADREVMDSIYAKSQSGEEPEDDNGKAEPDMQAAEMAVLLKNSLDQIFDYAGYAKDKADAFRTNIDAFVALKDKLEITDETRHLRREIEKGFYDLYECVFAVAAKSNSIPKVIELFFNYGFVDERLITQESLIMLCSLKGEDSTSPCRVFTMTEWLKAVNEGRKEPSRNEMGLDFQEFLRQEKKQGNMTDEDIRQANEDGATKVHYEINNAMRSASRVTNGQFSVYVPVLFEEMITNTIAKIAITKKYVNDVFSDTLDADFSAFHREAMFVDETVGVDRFVVMTQVFPDIILTPVIGQNGSMWQEITGKRRESSGRFFIPILCTSRLENIMIKLFGNFRWELCKTMQGINWNNIQMKSLTSEYMDYLQFYRKNHDLTEEKREKIKLQIQRCRNNSREVFTSDYEVWMLAEKNGSIRLNKVVREMLATYCPFRKDYREQLLRQPTYEEAFARYFRETNKKLHEIELKHKSIERQFEVPKKMIDNYEFYKNN